MKSKFIVIVLVTIFVLGLGVEVAAYNLEQEITYRMEEGSLLEEAFTKLEAIADGEIIFYFDDRVDLSQDFKLLAGTETYKNVLNLILQFNNLEKIKLAEQLFYIYPSNKELIGPQRDNKMEQVEKKNGVYNLDNYLEQPNKE